MRVGMVGAGQLARMTQPAASALGIDFRVLAAAADDPAAQVVADTWVGGELAAFAEGCDAVTFDHELVDLVAVAALDRAAPSAAALRLAADKEAGRRRLEAGGFPVPAWAPVTDLEAVRSFGDERGWPLVLKAVRGGYDGRGVWVVADEAEVAAVIAGGVDLLVEEHVRIDRELAVLVARRPGGEAVVWPVVETVQVDGICHEVRAPVDRPDAAALGLAVAEAIGVVGILAVELFEAGGGLVVNELATRPHNSGHWTIEGAATSQFENHLRAVLDLPLGATAARAPAAVMVNVLGGPRDLDPRDRLGAALASGDVHVHLYGKVPRPGRKLGHVTALGDDPNEVRARAHRAAAALSGGDGMTPAPIAVGVVMGSDSDLAVMQGAADILTEFGVAHETRVVSAHRTPDDMLAYGHAAAERGLRVIIAGAGGAAHLPGMLASVTSLPVIGVPVPLANLGGLDSLLSIAQMPAGVPVATMAVGGARNAGLLAVRILALGDDALVAALDEHREGLARKAREADDKVRGGAAP